MHEISKRYSIFCTLEWGYQSLKEYEWDLGGWGFRHFGTFLALKKVEWGSVVIETIDSSVSISWGENPFPFPWDMPPLQIPGDRDWICRSTTYQYVSILFQINTLHLIHFLITHKLLETKELQFLCLQVLMDKGVIMWNIILIPNIMICCCSSKTCNYHVHNHKPNSDRM